jgi:hypothetical protein
MKAKEILIEALELPKILRVEFFMNQQKVSGYSENVFKVLIEELNHITAPAYLEIGMLKAYNKGVDFSGTDIEVLRVKGREGTLRKVMLSELEKLRTNIEDARHNISLAEWREEQKSKFKDQTYKTGLHSELSDEQLKSVYTTFKNKYFPTTTKEQFISTFRRDPLPEGWKRIKWNKPVSNIRYFVKLITDVSYPPTDLLKYIDAKILKNNQTQPHQLKKYFENLKKR